MEGEQEVCKETGRAAAPRVRLRSERRGAGGWEMRADVELHPAVLTGSSSLSLSTGWKGPGQPHTHSRAGRASRCCPTQEGSKMAWKCPEAFRREGQAVDSPSCH